MAWAESKDGSQEVLGTSSGDSVVDLPMVCLVNGNTASAAELFASCLRDMSGARLVGNHHLRQGHHPEQPPAPERRQRRGGHGGPADRLQWGEL